MKPVILSSLLTFLLCAPAVADTPPSPGSQIRASFVISTGKRVRQYELTTLDGACARTSSKDSDARIEDNIEMCARGGDRLFIEWSSRDGSQEYRNSSSLLVRPGARLELDGNGAKLTVALK